MWFLVEPGPGGSRIWLRPGSSLTIGRQAADVALVDCRSVSRRHATISVAPLADSDASDLAAWPLVSLEDHGSKLGTHVGLSTLLPITGTKVSLSHGQCVRFGSSADGRTFKLVRDPVVVCTSGLKRADRAAVRSAALLTDFKIVPDFDQTCTHLVMDLLLVTVKVVRALSLARPIVTLAWIDALAAATAVRFAMPDPSRFLPPEHPSQEWPGVCFGVDERRKTLFSGVDLFVFSQWEKDTVDDIVAWSGGRSQLVQLADPNNPTADDELMLQRRLDAAPRPVVIIPADPALQGLAERIRDILKRTGFAMARMSHDQIAMAILYVTADPSAIRTQTQSNSAAPSQRHPASGVPASGPTPETHHESHHESHQDASVALAAASAGPSQGVAHESEHRQPTRLPSPASAALLPANLAPSLPSIGPSGALHRTSGSRQSAIDAGMSVDLIASAPPPPSTSVAATAPAASTRAMAANTAGLLDLLMDDEPSVPTLPCAQPPRSDPQSDPQPSTSLLDEPQAPPLPAAAAVAPPLSPAAARRDIRHAANAADLLSQLMHPSLFSAPQQLPGHHAAAPMSVSSSVPSLAASVPQIKHEDGQPLPASTTADQDDGAIVKPEPQTEAGSSADAGIGTAAAGRKRGTEFLLDMFDDIEAEMLPPPRARPRVSDDGPRDVGGSHGDGRNEPTAQRQVGRDAVVGGAVARHGADSHAGTELDTTTEPAQPVQLHAPQLAMQVQRRRQPLVADEPHVPIGAEKGKTTSLAQRLGIAVPLSGTTSTPLSASAVGAQPQQQQQPLGAGNSSSSGRGELADPNADPNADTHIRPRPSRLVVMQPPTARRPPANADGQGQPASAQPSRRPATTRYMSEGALRTLVKHTTDTLREAKNRAEAVLVGAHAAHTGHAAVVVPFGSKPLHSATATERPVLVVPKRAAAVYACEAVSLHGGGGGGQDAVAGDVPGLPPAETVVVEFLVPDRWTRHRGGGGGGGDARGGGSGSGVGDVTWMSETGGPNFKRFRRRRGACAAGHGSVSGVSGVSGVSSVMDASGAAGDASVCESAGAARHRRILDLFVDE
ncbi:hypothetical protein BC831DRAFT_478415 [Entophlyctis helioformis]|nr:hypothetical protein BC831DRAFT_478415 [Entophlyctis helioformis]